MDLDKLKTIIAYYGERSQIYKAVEELTELSEILIKRNNKAKTPINISDLYSEMADVYIMLVQLFMIFNLDSTIMNDEISGKIERTMERIYGDEEAR